MFRRIFLLALLGAAAFAQTAAPAEKPPADVDKAFRARLDQFYTFLKNKEFRKAEGLIAEDTKDYYYEGGKPDISQFEVLEVHYSDGFTRANAITQCTQTLMIPGFPSSEVHLKIPSTWRLEDGNWYLFVDQSKILSPVGLPMKQVPSSQAPDGAGAATAGIPKEIAQDPAFALGKVQADKAKVHLPAGATERVTIANGTRGPISLELGYPLKGVEAELDRAELPGGEKAVLSLKAGDEPTGGIFYLRIMPTEEVLRISVDVK
jgi:hypothetical protein